MIAPHLVIVPLASLASALTSEARPMLWWATEVASLALVLTAATLFWTLRLQRLVRERTAELESKNRELERESADRRLALQAVQISDNRLRMATEAGQLRTWHWDIASDRFEIAGERAAELGPGLPSAAVGMDRFLQPIHTEDIDLVREVLTRAIQTGEPIGIEFRVVLPDATIRWKVVRGCAVRDANGRHLIAGGCRARRHRSRSARAGAGGQRGAVL